MNYSSLRATGAAFSCFLTGCAAGAGPAQEPSVSDLLHQYELVKHRDCERREFAGWQTDMKCVADRQQKMTELAARIRARHVAELAAAPECLKRFSVPEEVLTQAGVDPNLPVAIADLLSRGFMLSSVLQESSCAVAVCQWRTKADPNHAGPYCP